MTILNAKKPILVGLEGMIELIGKTNMCGVL